MAHRSTIVSFFILGNKYSCTFVIYLLFAKQAAAEAEAAKKKAEEEAAAKAAKAKVRLNLFCIWFTALLLP